VPHVVHHRPALRARVTFSTAPHPLQSPVWEVRLEVDGGGEVVEGGGRLAGVKVDLQWQGVQGRWS
jgi:hypothetical protein